MNSIRWTAFNNVNTANSAYNSIVGFEMSGLTPGATYQLQLLIYEECCTGRNHKIELVNGTTATLVNGYQTTKLTADVITYGFVASSKSATVKLTGIDGGTDKNPIISGFSLEVRPNAFNNLTVTGNKVTANHIAATTAVSISNTNNESAITGVISGSASLTKSGSGTLSLSASNTYAGGTTISGGTLSLDMAGSLTGTVLPDSGAITVNGGTLALNDLTETVGAVTLTSGAITVGTAGNTLTGTSYTLNPSSGTDHSISATLAGSGALTKSGVGTVTLSGANTYTGATTISAGTLVIGGSGSLGSGSYAGNISIANTNSGTFQYASSATQTLSGILSGAGAVTVSGSGALTLTGNNTYTGITTVNAGSTLSITPASAFTQNLSGGFVNNGTVNYNGSNGSGAGAGSTPTNITNASGSGAWNITSSVNPSMRNNRLVLTGAVTTSGQITVNNFGNLWINGNTVSEIDSTSPINLNGANTNLRIYGVANAVLMVGTLTGSGIVDFVDGGAGKALTLSLGNDNGTGIFSGSIQNSGTSSGPTVVALVKNGTGTQTLSGANTYTGSTTISGGILSISSDANLGAVPGSVTASSINLNGGTLLVTADVTLNSNRGITLGASSTISVDTGDTVVYAGIITDGASSNGLTKAGAGTLKLVAANTYDGGTTVSAGTLGIYNNGSLGSGALTFTGDSNLLLGRAVTDITNSIVLNANATVDFDTNVEYLVVAGGGGGGSRHGGGGGAGGVLTGNSDVDAASVTVVVGGGGSGATASVAPTNGGNSSLSFLGTAAVGGGYGAGWFGNAT